MSKNRILPGELGESQHDTPEEDGSTIAGDKAFPKNEPLAPTEADSSFDDVVARFLLNYAPYSF